MNFNNIYSQSFVKYFKKLNNKENNNKESLNKNNKTLNKNNKTLNKIFDNLLSDINESYKKVYANDCFKGYIYYILIYIRIRK
jgi:esterase/lipase